jgi:PAS domain S-box-containing protein
LRIDQKFVGIGLDIPDSSFIRSMKDYQKMSKAELLALIKNVKSRHVRSSRAQQKQATSDVRDREERLRAILETAVEGIITIDERGIVESFNHASEKIFGYKAPEVIGKNISLLMPSPYREAHDSYLAHYTHTGHAKIIGIGREVEGRRKDGSIFPMELSVSEVKLADRRLFTGFVRDITERKRAEKSLLYHAAIVESSDDAIIGKTLDGYITSWNKGAENIFGYVPKEVIGKHISILIPPERANEESDILQKIKAGQSVEHSETLRRRKDGRLIHVSVTISPIRQSDGKIIGASKIARDITERKRLQEEILEISEREQRRIGHDLHDGLCQHLAAIELMSEVLEKKLTRQSKSAATQVNEIGKNVREVISQTRALARGLSPVTLESDALVSALHELALNTEKMFNLECQFDCDSEVLIHSHAAAIHLFRLAQEAVSNAVQHGKAKHISIQLKADSHRVYLGVSDNGSGIPVEIPKTKGMGLRIMQFRAEMIGGTLVVQRNASGGTSVICSAPNPAANSNQNGGKK